MDDAHWRLQQQFGAVGKGSCPQALAPKTTPSNVSYEKCSLMADGSFVCDDIGNRWMQQVSKAGMCPLPQQAIDSVHRTSFADCSSEVDGVFLCGTARRPPR